MAKKFTFRLDVVRNLREQTRDRAVRALAEGVAQAGAIERRLESLSQQTREAVSVGRLDRLEAQLEVSALRAQEYHGRWLLGRIIQSGEELATARRVCEDQRVRLAEATAKLKAIEKLRQRRWKRHQFEVRREEQAALDEVAGQISRRALDEESDA